MAHLKSFTALDAIDLLLTVAGAILLAAEIAWQMPRPRRDPLRGSPLRVNTLSLAWVWLALFIYGVSGFLGGGVASFYSANGPAADVALWRSILAGNVSQVVVIAAMLLIGLQTFIAGPRGFGIDRQPLARDITAAVRILLVGFCVCNGIVWITEAAFQLLAPRFEMPPHTVFTTLSLPATPRFVRINAILGAALFAPVGEELLFRVILQTGFHKIFPPRSHSLRHRWAAILCAGTLFGCMHLATPQYVPALIALGILLGYLYERTGSILAPIYLHVLFNCKSLMWHYLG